MSAEEDDGCMVDTNDGDSTAVLLDDSPVTPESAAISAGLSSSDYEEIPLVTSGSESGYDDNDGVAPVHDDHGSTTPNGNTSPVTKMNLTNSEDIYAVIDKSRVSPDKTLKVEEVLPSGWKKCYDDDGAYYWHIRTGRIQRDKPEASEGDKDALSPADHLKSMESSLINLAGQTMKSMTVNDDVTYSSGPEQTLKFAVHSIGWVPLAESDLKDQETSCRSINRCIIDLTAGRANEGLGQWAEGKELRMEIDGRELCLVDPISTTVLSVQPIHTIRVWGVGSQSDSDFAYVARDPTTRIHKCHVFRCEVPARQIANTLKEICTRLAKERKLKSNCPDRAERDKLTALQLVAEKGKVVLPSPMDGPSKTKKCHYLGSVAVHKATGMDVVNTAIEKVANSTERCDWTLVNVTVSPAAIKVTNIQDESEVLLEARLRYLCFFCISAHDVRLMGMIVHTAENEFVAHVFHCEPSAGALCKIIEAACKLRYQKLLDSMPDQVIPESTPSPNAANKGIQHTVKNIIAKVWPVRKS